METMEIPTRHGPALLWWDDESDPDNPGWVLRYHRSPDQDAVGLRNLDEILDAGPDPQEARRQALAYLAREGLDAAKPAGALYLGEVADRLGVSTSTVRAYRARGQMPTHDGADYNGHPWWLPSTLAGWRPEFARVA